MTTSSVIDIRSCSFHISDRLFLDANVWLAVYGPVHARRTRSIVYSRALADMRTAGSEIYLDVLVLSEFVNAYARMEHRQSSLRDRDFKDFRRSPAFPAVAADIGQNAARIVRQCRLTDTNLSVTDVRSLLVEFERGQSDFNDQMIADMCRSKGLKLVTHDADFKSAGLAILTANNSLLTP